MATADRQRQWREAKARHRARQRGQEPPFVPYGEEPFGGGEWTPEGCLEWRGARLDRGYGRVWRDGRVQSVHRVALELKLGRPRGRAPWQQDYLDAVRSTRDIGRTNP